MIVTVNEPIVLVKSEWLPDWWTIERAVHDNTRWMKPTEYGTALQYSGRITDACVEGTSAEMLEIADAIERGESVSFNRCSAEHTPEGYLFESPRNSNEETALVPHEHARALALDIRTKIASG